MRFENDFHCSVLGESAERFNRAIAPAHDGLAHEAFASAVNTGKAMALDDAFAFAVEVTDG